MITHGLKEEHNITRLGLHTLPLYGVISVVNFHEILCWNISLNIS